jgi:hypothetical protein
MPNRNQDLQQKDGNLTNEPGQNSKDQQGSAGEQQQASNPGQQQKDQRENTGNDERGSQYLGRPVEDTGEGGTLY